MHNIGEPCEKEHSTCNGRNEMCIGRGPAWEADDHGYKSNEIIARRQSDKAKQLWQQSAAIPISGLLSVAHVNLEGTLYLPDWDACNIDYRLAFLDISALTVAPSKFSPLLGQVLC